MKRFIPIAAAAVLISASTSAFALEANGTIKSLDMSKDMIVLDNGASYMAPKTVKLSAFKVGEKVTVDYTKTGDKMEVTTVKPAA